MSHKTCVIIGAGEGLGHALSRKFAEENFNLALISRSKEGSRAALDEAQKSFKDGKHLHFFGDALQPESITEAAQKVIETYENIEVLIYNVRGGYELKEPLDMTFSDLESIYKIEVVGAFAAVKVLLPGMIEKKQGKIIFSSATAALRGSGTNPIYAIGKFGLRALSQSLAKAYSKKGVHISHVRLDCALDVPLIREWYGKNFKEEETANVHDVAQNYWWIYLQPKSAWSNEVELRPFTEDWTF